jgi:TBC1 domain family protein 5
MFKIKDGLKKLKNIIKKEEEEEPIEKKNLSLSYNNFILHYNDPKKALLRDIDNIKKCKTLQCERDFMWLFYLRIIPFKNPTKWQKILTEERAKYLALKNKYISKDIQDFLDLKRIDNTYKYDGYKQIISKEEFDLINLIKVDVDRTYQENEIFLKEDIKKALTCALYIYAKENPKYGYRQGMNDICGVFLYVLYKNYTYEDSFEKDTISCTYSIFHCNNKFLEHDLFLMFSKFMNKGISEFFLYNSIKYKNSFLSSKTFDEKMELTEKEIIECDDSSLKKRAYVLYYKHFRKIDSKFYDVLVFNVEPELFMTRWYLLVFTREFNIDQIIYLWDLIILYEFVESKLYKNRKLTWHYNFMDCIALSMLINCKPDVIVKKEDINDLMSSIMHYPPNISIEKIAKKALEIYNKLNPEIRI